MKENTEYQKLFNVPFGRFLFGLKVLRTIIKKFVWKWGNILEK